MSVPTLAGLRATAGTTFASLSTATTAATSAGQAVSLIGTWMQTVAQSWLVYS